MNSRWTKHLENFNSLLADLQEVQVLPLSYLQMLKAIRNRLLNLTDTPEDKS